MIKFRVFTFYISDEKKNLEIEIEGTEIIIRALDALLCLLLRFRFANLENK